MNNSPSSDTPQFPDIVGRMAGEYRLKKKLGEGGFGAVYEAEHPLLRRKAAVKVLHKAAAANSDAVLRFIGEAQSVNQIRSPHIVDIFSFGKLPDGRHFFVMDLLDGEPLDSFLLREKSLDITSTIQLLSPITQALDAAHAAGIVHRDLKPQNIYLAWQSNGETFPKLLDFGLAKLLDDSPVRTASGTPMGTPLYMSPEQAKGEKVDRRADVYALGVLCHELLTGQPPIFGDSTVAVLLAHLTQPPPRASDINPALPTELDGPILRMLEKDPVARPASAGEALAELRQAAERAGFVIPEGMPKLHRPTPGDNQLEDEGGNATTENAPPLTDPYWDHSAMARTTSGRVDRKSYGWPILGLCLLLGGTATFMLTRGRWQIGLQTPAERSTPANSITLSTVTEAASPSPSAAAMAAPMRPTTIELLIDGAPNGAEVSLDGKILGRVPGPVEVPYGLSPLKLQVSATGYTATALTFVPEKSSSVTVHMSRRPAGNVAPRAAIPKDLENPF